MQFLLRAILLATFSALAAAGWAAEKPPNIVLLISDDQRWDDYGFMGHRVIETPHLDQLARESLVFERGYVPSSLCRPSLATMITGLYPHQHGITGNDPRENKQTPEGRAVLVDRFKQNPRLPDLLQQAGYLSFQSGKWWEGHYSSGGFTHGMTHGDVTRGGRHGDVGLKIGREGLQPVFEFIDHAAERQKPFLLWYAPMMPHLPHTPPKALLDKYHQDNRPEPVARYYAMCEWWDQTCGELLSYLEDKQLAENTIVIYLADNGWTQLDEQGGGAVGGPRGKRSAYDGGVRTPIMIRWPGQIAPRREHTGLASSIDVVPTVLAAVGLEVPNELPGLNLLDEEAVAKRERIFGEIFTHDIPDIDRPAAALLYRWVLDGEWKLIVPTEQASGEFGPEEIALFHLREDPNEQHNLARERPEIVEVLQRALERWWPAK